MRLRLPHRSRFACGSAVLLVVALSGAAGAEISATEVHNFDRVNAHIFRGGRPTPTGLRNLYDLGVRLDIDLRESSDVTDAEKHEAEKLGIKYVNIPFSSFGAPTSAQMQQVLALLLTNEKTPIFVHCRRGKDRTGTVVACYRIQHDGWTNQRALQEAKQHGMSATERGMRSYILHYTPLKVPSPVPLIP